MLRIPARGRHVTQEPSVIAPHLLGRPLATFRRRSLAYLFDLILFATLFGVLFLGLTLLNVRHADPTLLPRLEALMSGEAPADSTSASLLALDALVMVGERTPDALPPPVAEAVAARDLERVKREFLDRDVVVVLSSGPTRLRDGRFEIGPDLLLGRYSSVFSWGAFFVGWFTLWTRLLKGRTPGKFLFGLQIVKLDGKPLSWWDAFGRSGGYGASAATAFLGFLEAIWHPNRQAIHDRISGTVVIRHPLRP